ncbi:ACS family MFS transporter [Pseudomaricurvus alkylphenolicus]|uniref:MFS transporter n=1 Tax=Pseudomaricurvus alkylphenolicus TaxID=1306991 RepID=UPI001421FAAD|nr:MFS transporter [Pseudomaricurvus alkylphenolicus]NIB41702.1 ACS family MFS transporter [Pseudomaricurvus alkylphenolicus]
MTQPPMESGRQSGNQWQKRYTVILLAALAICICYIDRVIISVAIIDMQKEFGWDEATKGIVLSAFFAGYFVMQTFGGVLSNRFGGRLVLGISVLLWSLFTLVTPLAAASLLLVLLTTRLMMGLGEGAAFPASFNIAVQWAPVAERSRTIALLMSSASLGTLFALTVTGWLITEYGWRSVFYLFGIVGLLWVPVWFKLVPKQSTVSSQERQSRDANGSIPWRLMLTQPAVLAVFAVAFTYGWTSYTFVAWLPSYFNDVYQVSLASAGLYAAGSWGVKFVMMNANAWVADWLVARGLSKALVRKLMLGLGQMGTAIGIISLNYVQSIDAAFALMCIIFSFMAFTVASFSANIIEVSPQYADVLSGPLTSFVSVAGFISVALTGAIVQWTGGYNMAFIVAAIMCLGGSLIFVLYCSVEDVVAKAQEGCSVNHNSF